MKRLSIKQRVENGAKFLDKHFGGPWRAEFRKRLEIEGQLFDIENCDRCVLGLLLGDYFRAKRMFGLTDADARRNGFLAYRCYNDAIELETAWLRTVRAAR